MNPQRLSVSLINSQEQQYRMSQAATSYRTATNMSRKANLKRWVMMYFILDLKYRRESQFNFSAIEIKRLQSNKICCLDINVQFYSFIHFLSYNLMALLQRIVNFVTILACTVVLVYLNSNIDQLSTQKNELLELTSLIGHGVALSEQQLNKLASISALESDYLKKNSPICLLKAYQEVVIKGKIDPEATFHIFQSGKQFAGISTCNHYYSLLIFRASRIQSKEKVRIQAILNGLLAKQFQGKKTSKICIYHYGFNSEVIVKKQMGQIIHQEYNNFNAVIDVDGSNDNTHMFAKYMLEERKDKTHSIELVTEPQRKGFIENFNKIIDKSCQDDSIVLFLNKHQVLLSPHSLSIVNSYFATTSNTIVVFKSLTNDHENIQRTDKANIPSIYPILALKKSQLTKLNQIAAKISENSKKDSLLINYQHELFIFSLLKQPKLLQKIGHSNDAIVYRQSRHQIQQQVLRNFFEKE